MADAKLDELTSLPDPSDEDLIYILDDPSGSPGDRQATVSAVNRFAFGVLSVTASAVPTTLAAGTWTKVTIFDSAVSGPNVTADHTNDLITLDKAGWYAVSWQVTFIPAAGAESYRFALWHNGAEVGVVLQHTSVDIAEENATLSFLFNAATAADDLEAYAFSGGGADLTITDSILSVHRIY